MVAAPLWVEACLCRGQAVPPLAVGLAAQCHPGTLEPVQVLPPLVEDSPLAQVAPRLVAPRLVALLPDLACRPLVVVVDRLRPGQVVARPCRLPMAAAAEALLPRALVVARPRLALVVVLPRRVLVVARPRLAPVAALPRRP